MWGDAEGAHFLTPSDKLSKSLLKVTGPSHIQYHDSKWQELLLHYDRLVHLNNPRFCANDNSDVDVVGQACSRCAKHCSTSSNLAALGLHVARMIRDLQCSVTDLTSAYNTTYSVVPTIDETDTENADHSRSEHSTTKKRIALIGKARATCGAIHLLVLFVHETIIEACRQQQDTVSNGSSFYYDGQPAPHDVNYILRESFTYRSRDLNGIDAKMDGQDAALELVSSLMSFLGNNQLVINHDETSSPQGFFDILSIPEIYDVVVQMLSLLLVLFSTQLYQPMVSSAQLAEREGTTTSNHYFLERMMDYAVWQRQNSRQLKNNEGEVLTTVLEMNENDTRLLLHCMLSFVIRRPKPPKRSIASHYVELTYSIAHQLPASMSIAADGMYESHSIVTSTISNGESFLSHKGLVSRSSNPRLKEDQATSQAPSLTTIALGTDDAVGFSSPGHVSGEIPSRTSSSLLFPIRSILLLSSSLVLLPIRLVKLAIHMLRYSGLRTLLVNKQSLGSHDLSTSDHAALRQFQSYCEKASGWEMTNNILWITDSPMADLSSALILLLTNNCRTNSESGNNPFRVEMATLNDKRWDGEMTTNSADTHSLFPSTDNVDTRSLGNIPVLSANFESLFHLFGKIAHTEVGALMLYTILQSSPLFAASLASRSDLDTIVMPLLRTLYFSSKLTHEASHGQVSPFVTLLHKDRPFRAQSHLYIILILLLIFSQDPSFGKDSFRRVSVSEVKWYKERPIKDMSLGSMMILVLIKAITFNLNRLRDEFLLSNCIAVLLNLSPHIIHLHPYVASRLVSVTVSCFNRYTALVAKNDMKIEEEGDMTSPLGMHGETFRTLIQLIKHSIRPKSVGKNLDLVYAILLEEASFQKILHYAPIKQLDITPIIAVIDRATNIIQDLGHSASAEETMRKMKSCTDWTSKDSIPRTRANSFDSLSSDASDIGNLTFTYEEESDPEIFFAPYIWDVIVCTLTASTVEWARDRIQVFPLNNDNEREFGSDADDIVDAEYSEYNHTPDVV